MIKIRLKPVFRPNNLTILLFIILLSTTDNCYLSVARSDERVDIINNDTAKTPEDLLINLKKLLAADNANNIKYLSKNYFNINENIWEDGEYNNGKLIQQVTFDKNLNRNINKFTPYSIRIYFEINSTRRQIVIIIYDKNEFIITPNMVIDTFGNPDDKFFIKKMRDINKSLLVYRYDKSCTEKLFPGGFKFTFINPNDAHKIYYRKSFLAGTKYDSKPSNIEFENELNRRLDFNVHKEYRSISMVFGNIHHPILYGD